LVHDVAPELLKVPGGQIASAGVGNPDPAVHA
jgi:hypothetical protein